MEGGGYLPNPNANNTTVPAYRTLTLVHDQCFQMESYKLRAFAPLSVQPALLQVRLLAVWQSAFFWSQRRFPRGVCVFVLKYGQAAHLRCLKS